MKRGALATAQQDYFVAVAELERIVGVDLSTTGAP